MRNFDEQPWGISASGVRIVESTNSWLSNYGQLRRNTDRKTQHRHAQLCLVAAVLITARLIDWRDRWSPDSGPIR